VTEFKVGDRKPVSGFPGYEVSPLGYVWGPRGFALKGSSKIGGYLSVSLRKDGKSNSTLVHRIVALTFLGIPPSPNHQVAHNDGDPTNNHVDNLSWKTPVENCKDRDLHGRTCRGDMHRDAVLTEEIVRNIRKDYAEGLRQKDIVEKYGVPTLVVSRCVRRVTWKHVL
jgi:hypothetical protein